MLAMLNVTVKSSMFIPLIDIVHLFLNYHMITGIQKENS